MYPTFDAAPGAPPIAYPPALESYPIQADQPVVSGSQGYVDLIVTPSFQANSGTTLIATGTDLIPDLTAAFSSYHPLDERHDGQQASGDGSYDRESTQPTTSKLYAAEHSTISSGFVPATTSPQYPAQSFYQPIPAGAASKSFSHAAHPAQQSARHRTNRSSRMTRSNYYSQLGGGEMTRATGTTSYSDSTQSAAPAAGPSSYTPCPVAQPSSRQKSR